MAAGQLENYVAPKHLGLQGYDIDAGAPESHAAFEVKVDLSPRPQSSNGLHYSFPEEDDRFPESVLHDDLYLAEKIDSRPLWPEALGVPKRTCAFARGRFNNGRRLPSHIKNAEEPWLRRKAV